MIQALDAVGQGSILTQDGKDDSLPLAFAVPVGLAPLVSAECSLQVTTMQPHGRILGQDPGGQQAVKVLPANLTPTAPHPRPLSGSCQQGEPVFWHVFGWCCVGYGLRCPPRQGPPLLGC